MMINLEVLFIINPASTYISFYMKEEKKRNMNNLAFFFFFALSGSSRIGQNLEVSPFSSIEFFCSDPQMVHHHSQLKKAMKVMILGFSKVRELSAMGLSNSPCTIYRHLHSCLLSLATCSWRFSKPRLSFLAFNEIPFYFFRYDSPWTHRAYFLLELGQLMTNNDEESIDRREILGERLNESQR